MLTPAALLSWQGTSPTFSQKVQQDGTWAIEALTSAALEIDTAVLAAGKGLMGIVEQAASVLQIDLRSMNGGW